VIWPPVVIAAGDVQVPVMPEPVQAIAVYEAGATPVDAVNVAVMAPAVVVDDAVEKPVGGYTWLVSACGAATVEVDARYPVEAVAVTVA
jgi:hypothetical protein